MLVYCAVREAWIHLRLEGCARDGHMRWRKLRRPALLVAGCSVISSAAVVTVFSDNLCVCVCVCVSVLMLVCNRWGAVLSVPLCVRLRFQRTWRT